MTRSDLPKRVYIKHNAYYYVTPVDRVWKRLCALKDGLPGVYRALAALKATEVVGDRMPAVITRWVDEKRDEWAPKTAKDQDRIARIMSDRLAEFTPAQMTTPACNTYLKKYAKTPRTFNIHRSMLKQVLAFAAVDGLREGFNPVDNIPLKKLAGRKRIVTDAEVVALKAAALKATRNGEALVQMIDLAMLTGQRIGDLIKLRWQDVTDDGLMVQQGKTSERLLIEWTPALRAAIAACRPKDADPIGHVLRTQSGRGYRYAGIRSAWVRACERACIEDLNIHDLRGRAGVDSMGDGEDIKKAQRLLGHKAEGMTRHYVDGKYHKRTKPAR